jgi:hypothetical protein
MLEAKTDGLKRRKQTKYLIGASPEELCATFINVEIVTKKSLLAKALQVLIYLGFKFPRNPK